MEEFSKNHHHSLETRKKVVDLHDKGWSAENIFEATNVPSRTQRRYIQKNKSGLPLYDKQQNKEVWNRNNSKITEDYVKRLKSKLDHQNDLTAIELRKQLELETGIDITEGRIYQILKKNKITNKKKHSIMKMLTSQSTKKEPKISFNFMTLNQLDHMWNIDHF